MPKHWDEYGPQNQTRELMHDFRHDLQLSYADVAKLIAEDTGYNFTADQYRAIEQGLTKNIPLWVVISFMRVVVHADSADRLFPYIGREW